VSDQEDPTPTEAPGAGAADPQLRVPDRPPGGTRRVVIAVVIVVLVVAFAAALSISGARDHHHTEVGMGPAPPHSILAVGTGATESRALARA
jgi:hypothetical protein